MKQVTIKDFLTDNQIEKCIEIYKKYPDYQRAKGIAELVISPNIEKINKKLKQKNDPMYLAYAVCFILSQEEK